MRKFNLKFIAAAATLLIAAAVAITVWREYVSPTRIAFVNYPEYVLAPLLDQEINPSIEVTPLKWTEQSGDELKNFDAVIFFGMGLHFTERQRKLLSGFRKPLYVTASTRQETGLCTLTGEQLSMIGDYLGNGGRENFRRMLNYIRCELDGKRFRVEPVEPAKEVLRAAFFHVAEDSAFKTYKEYLAYYRSIGKYNPANPTVCLLSGNGGGDLESVISSLEKKNINVVAANGMGRLVEMVDEVNPDLVIYQPHGRISYDDPAAAVRLFRERNIPLFCPIKVNQPYEEYLRDQRGMTGGMLSQSVTMPELDGGTVPFVLSALFRNERGLYEFRTIPDRLERFSELVRKTLDLRRKANKDKKIAIIYYKEPGKNALTAGGLEVGDSLFNTLKYLQKQGFTTGPLPDDPEQLMKEIQENAAVFGSYAEGAIREFMQRSRVEVITPEQYLGWVKKAMPEDLYATVTERYGAFPGNSFAADDGMVLGRLQFGNIVLMPQSLPGSASDGDDGRLVHGIRQAPPHTYLATYLWIRYGFRADALIHFGTHGSLEFTPWKQVALSSHDWPDVLIGEMPHYYLYVINNIGEALIARRRSYATMVSHLTAPFMNSGSYGPQEQLDEKIRHWETAENEMLKAEYAKSILELVKKEKFDLEVKFSPGFAAGKLTGEDLELLHNHLHEISNTKVNRGMYVIGRPYSDAEADETARLMMVDTVADKLFTMALEKGEAREDQKLDNIFYEKNFLVPARERIERAFSDPEAFRAPVSAGVPGAPAGMEASPEELKGMLDSGKLPDGRDMPPAMAEAVKLMMPRPDREGGERRKNGSARMKQPVPPPELEAVKVRGELLRSTEEELRSLVNALSGGYLSPSPGGDPVGNPDTVPTGRNLYGIDPERTPTRESYAVGRQLGQALIDEKLSSTGKYPEKVAFTLWGGEFIRTQGSDIGEIFFLLGVEPVWDSRGRVQDVRLIPSAGLKRPRIDVVVQTSGQFRGAATSRMRLIDKAVRLAAADGEGEYGNRVARGSLDAVRALIASGMSPEEARKFADARIFGGVNGNFGTGVTGMVQSGDRWDDSAVIADLYLNNMGALYTEEHWGEQVPGVFRAALSNTDTVVQSRSSNSWGPLSLDHVYEFTGGINLAVRNVTGREPDAYFNDQRTPGRPRVQEAGQAAMVEARSTLLNPKYIKEMMQEGPSAAGTFAEAFRNTYGWEVMKPEMIRDHLWEEYKSVYLDDSLNLGIREFFESENPYALQEMTGVMLETVRKGLWKADPATVRQIAETHAKLVGKFGAGCSGFVCGNAKLREMIQNQIDNESLRRNYRDEIEKVLNPPAGPGKKKDAKIEEVSGQTLKEEKIEPPVPRETGENRVAALTAIGGIVLAALLSIVIGNRLRRRKIG